MSELDKLTADEGAISALNRAAVIYARRRGLDVTTLSRTITAIVAVESAGQAIPAWAVDGSAPDPKEAGPIARRALQAMLDSPPAEGLNAAASDAIADELSGRPHLVDPISIGIGAGLILALAVLSKWSWSRDKGHQFATGFPDLDKVLGKIGPIFAKLS